MKNALIILVLATSIGIAQAHADDAQKTAQGLPRVPLMDVLDATAKNADLVFVVDERAPADIVIGQQKLRSIGYPELLVILKNNGLAATKMQGLATIVPVALVRQQGVPIVDVDDDATSDAEWVTMILAVREVPATHLVPILRPLLPQAGHLAASPAGNAIIIVDRFANARRVARIVEKLDVAPLAAAKES